MIILITQPTFLPWLGYFDQIRIADKVVFLIQFNLQEGLGRIEIE